MIFRLAVLAASFALCACSVATQPAETPAEPAQAAAPRPAPEAAPVAAPAADEGPKLIDGYYIFRGCEGEGGCDTGYWRTLQPTAVLTEQDPGSAILATLEPGEWVYAEEVQTLLIPQRGVVLADYEDLRTGDVVYVLEYEGEGYSTVWHAGRLASIGPDTQIQMDGNVAPPEMHPKLGLWARVKLEDGPTGWIHQPQFECMWLLGGDENCRE